MKQADEVDYERACNQHAAFCEALSGVGFHPIHIEPEERFPDGVFTEDPCLVLEDPVHGKHVLVRARLARPERQGEEARLLDRLVPKFFNTCYEIKEPGYVEGGDVVIAPALRRLYIGLSARTNEAGAEQLARIARDTLGYETIIVKVPSSFLHLKGEVTFHARKDGRHWISVSEEIEHAFTESGCELIVTPAFERFGANCISSNGTVLARAGAPHTKALLERAGHVVREVDISQFILIDGALTCLWKKIP